MKALLILLAVALVLAGAVGYLYHAVCGGYSILC